MRSNTGMILKQKKYRILLITEVVLMIISGILDSVWHISEYPFSNNMGLLILMFPIWLFLFWLRKENLKPIAKVFVYFCFIVLTVLAPFIFITAWG